MSINMVGPFESNGSPKILPSSYATTSLITDKLRFRYAPILSGNFSVSSVLILVFFICITLVHDILMYFELFPQFDFCRVICYPGINMVTIFVGDVLINVLFFIVFFFPIDYSQYEISWRSIGFSIDDPFIANELKRTKNESLFFMLFFLLFWLFCLPGCVYIDAIQPHELGWLQYSMEISHQTVYGISSILFYIKIHSIFTSSSLIRASFILLGKSIRSHPEVTWSIESLQHYRRIYNQIIGLTEASNNIWSIYLSFTYPSFNIMGLLIIYTMITGSYDVWRYIILGFCALALFWSLSFMNKYIIGINTEAAAIYEIIYEKSFLDLGEKYMMESLLFMDRIGRADVGYRLHGKFVFSPTLMASMVTLGVTVIIAFPSFAH